MLLLFKNSFDDGADLWGRTVEENADAVDLCGKDTNADRRADQNGNRDRDLVPCHGAHADPREHRHGGGEGNIRADEHSGIIDLAVAHREDNDHESDNEKERDRHDGGIDVLKLRGCRADRAVHECINEESENKEYDHIDEQLDRNIEDRGDHGIGEGVLVDVVEQDRRSEYKEKL